MGKKRVGTFGIVEVSPVPFSNIGKQHCRFGVAVFACLDTQKRRRLLCVIILFRQFALRREKLLLPEGREKLLVPRAGEQTVPTGLLEKKGLDMEEKKGGGVRRFYVLSLHLCHFTYLCTSTSMTTARVLGCIRGWNYTNLRSLYDM